MENGYAGTSMLEIATRAKVSKREIYAVCEDKAALLREAIADRAQRMRLPLELPAPKDRGALAATLTAFGTALLRGVCNPAVRAVYWLAISESGNAPEVARLLDKGGRGASRAALAQTLAQAQADSLLGAGDPAAMAVDFVRARPAALRTRRLGTRALYSRRFGTVNNYFVQQGVYTVEEGRAC